MRMMVGLTRPDAGDVRYDGVSYRQLRHPTRVVGAVLDARSVHPGRSARNHLAATAAMSGIPAGRVADVLQEVGLASAADQRAGTFSLGMRQRLALAGALLGEPAVLLLDEPSNGLDPDGMRWLRTSLRSFADHGGTVFVSSHLIAELAMFADDLVVVGAGRVLAAEPVRTTMARGGATVLVRSPHARNLAHLLTGRGMSVDLHEDRVSLRGATTTAVSQLAFDHRIQITEITETTRSLEEILIDMTGASAQFTAA
jgi:ABC-2 type transport system ATP-binding protein